MQLAGNRGFAVVLVALVATAYLWWTDARADSERARVQSIVEVHDAVTDRWLLNVGGKRLRKFTQAHVVGEFGNVLAELEIVRAGSREMILAIPVEGVPGIRQLRLTPVRGEPCDVPFVHRVTFFERKRVTENGLLVQTDSPFASLRGDNYANGIGVHASAESTAVPLVAERHDDGEDIARFVRQSVVRARIDEDGRGFFNGGTETGGADFAESVAVNAPAREFEPGDVLVIDTAGARRFALSRTADSPLVAGFHSTRPGVLARPGDVAGTAAAANDEVPLAITGIVPCKVCDEGGPVRAGDLLVAASVPGHAKKAPANPRAGTLVGKALGALEGSRGKVEVLITMR